MPEPFETLCWDELVAVSGGGKVGNWCYAAVCTVGVLSGHPGGATVGNPMMGPMQGPAAVVTTGQG
jgi:hypothetical protein